MSEELVLLGELLRRSDDAHASLDDFLARVAGFRQLADEVVRVANSELYSMPGKITRLERAVLILGRDAVASIASGLIAARVFAEEPARWEHSLTVALCAQEVARCLELEADHEIYRAGLLHELAPARAAACGFPEPLQQAIAHHGEPLRSPEPGRVLACLVHAAHLLTGDAPADPAFLGELGLLPDDADAIQHGLPARVKRAASLLQARAS